MKNKTLTKIFYSLYPAFLMSSVLLFLLFMIVGFCISNETASQILFILSFIFLLAYLPTFLLFSKVQNCKWYKRAMRATNLKFIQKQNELQLKEKAEQLKIEYGIK